jgi:hypothetical protein
LLVIALAMLVLPAVASANHKFQELVSTGPGGGNAEIDASFRGASEDGLHAFFETKESLVSADTDSSQDVYERSGLSTILDSAGGNGAYPANFARASADGTRVFFTTRESLVSADTDTSADVYERSGGTTTLVSTGPNGGSGAFNAQFDGASKDGAHVFFHTSEQLVSTDMDSSPDIYERSGGTTTLVSTGPDGGNAAIPALFRDASDDGTHVFFETYESLVSTDTDPTTDVYERFNGITTRVSFGPAGGNGGIDEFFDAFFAGTSRDGTHVFFETNEPLVSTDTDVQWDVYERAGGATTLVSTGPAGGNDFFDASFGGASADGTRVFFQTGEPLVSTDLDTSYQDVYERSGGTTTLVSTAPGDPGAPADASFVGTSDDGSHVFFTTPLSLLSSDADGGWRDIYERSGGLTSLVSTGPTDPNGPSNAFFNGASSDGKRVFFYTPDPLVSGDGDGGYDDVYERFGGNTTLISAGPAGSSNTSGASFAGASRDGTRAFFHTVEPLLTQDADSSQDVYAAKVDAGYPRPQSALQLNTSLVPAFKQCGAGANTANSRHSAPLAIGSCNPPTPTSAIARVGSSNSGSFAMTVGTGDFTITETNSDIRTAGGADYNPKPAGTPDLTATIRVRMTDWGNCTPTLCSASYDRTATTTDTDFGPIPIECVPNGSSSAPPGSDCNATTSANTLIPGIVVSGRQAVLQLFRVRVNDANNVLFQQQGFFTP